MGKIPTNLGNKIENLVVTAKIRINFSDFERNHDKVYFENIVEVSNKHKDV